MELPVQLDIGTAVEDLVDVDLDTKARRCTVTQMLSSRLRMATSGAQSSMGQLRFLNNSEVETGKQRAAVNASRSLLNQISEESTRRQLLF